MVFIILIRDVRIKSFLEDNVRLFSFDFKVKLKLLYYFLLKKIILFK